jgi:NADH-quinone oxidoreductase subunit C
MTEVAIGALAGTPTTGGIGVDQIAFPDRGSYHALVASLRDGGFEMCADLCAVDYLGHPGRTLPSGVDAQRFEVVVNLLSLSARRRVRVRVQVPESDPRIDSIFDLYPGTEAMEREAYDLLGILFDGHPDLSRILMPEDWEGHPLRKDFGSGRVPVQFKEAPGPR